MSEKVSIPYSERNRALVYLRVSTDRQAEKGIAIPTQQDKCFECAKEHGLLFDPERDVYVDRGESARSMDRPALLDMLERCKSNESIGAVVVYDVSRLARNREDFAFIKIALRKGGIRLIFATEAIDSSPEGQMMEGVLSTIAEFYSAQNARRVKLNMQKKVRDGWWPNRAPFGYKNVQEKAQHMGKVRAWVEINWEEAKWVIKVFELYATGNYSIQSLTAHLEAEGFPTRKRRDGSGRLHMSTVEEMLRNKFYIGTVAWGGIVNPDGRHELFLDRSLFEKVQALIDARNGQTAATAVSSPSSNTLPSAASAAAA
jgi:site-specific DNA recombinase